MRLYHWLVSTGAGLVLWVTAGCAGERAAARNVDRTSEIIQQANQLLDRDKELQRFHIVVDGFKGDMWLKGHVATLVQKQRAEKLLWAVSGVKSVDNRLEVSSAKP